MREVTPRVYLVGQTQIDEVVMERWLHELGADEYAKSQLPSNENVSADWLPELAGRRCYKSFQPGLNPNVKKVRTDHMEYVGNILAHAHGAVLEHVQTNWMFENVSRVFTHELVRHRAGTAFSQESLRYVRLTDLGFWYPPEVEANSEVKQLFRETVEFLEQQQQRLAEITGIEEEDSFGVKKRLTSAFRRIAPEGLATGIMFSANLRALRHVIELRTATSAEAEIRLVFGRVAQIAVNEWPAVFQDFVAGEPDEWGLVEWKPKHSKV